MNGQLRITRRLQNGSFALFAVLLLAIACALIAATAASAATPLVGTFKLAAGADAGGGVTGSYFRMIQPGGSVSSGPFVTNGSSSASDQTYTFLTPGSDGGLVTSGYQPEPSPAFDGAGNSLANRIIKPTGFFAVNFAVHTAAIDPQTSTSVPTPAINDDGAGNLSGDLRAFGASWNNQEFNQGSPKPDGSTPGLTAGPTGTYNSVTGAFALDWTSLIVGGPFNGFTGRWHLTGTFVSPSGTPGGGGPNGAPLVPKLVKVHRARSPRFRSAAKRFTVDTGYSFSNPAGEPPATVTVDATAKLAGGADASKRTRAVAKKAITVLAGATAPVKFALNREGARALRKHKKLRVSFRIRARVGSQTLTARGASKLVVKQ